jgi:drug/metabolite transporter (DMT)-like permease
MEIAAVRRAYVYVTLAAVFFSINASVSKVVLEAGVEPARLAAVRCTGAALGLGLVLLVIVPRRLKVAGRELPALAVLGVAGAALVQWLYFVAIDRVPVGIALLLEFTAPVLVALYARVVRREDVRRTTWLAIGLALGGLALVAQVWRDTGLDPFGVAAGLGAAVCVATYFLLGGHTTATRDPASAAFYMFGFGALFWAIAQPWWSFDAGPLAGQAPLLGALGAFTVPVWAGIAWVIVLGTVAPYALNLAALSRVSPTAVGVVGMSEPVLAALVAWAWLGQALTPVQVLGGLIVLAGIGMAQSAAVAHKSRPAASRRRQHDLTAAHPGRVDHEVERVGQAPHRATTLVELGYVDDGHVEPARGQLGADPRRARRHDDGPADHDGVRAESQRLLLGEDDRLGYQVE